MGKIASKYADKATVTDDNPRYENPARIREEVIGNLKNISEIGNRKLAIKKAISELKRGDLLLIAGKGHEKFQSIMGKNFLLMMLKLLKNIYKKMKKFITTTEINELFGTNIVCKRITGASIDTRSLKKVIFFCN